MQTTTGPFPGPQRLGQLVASSRKRIGISQRKLARDAGLDIATLSRLEQGFYASPTPATLQRLATTLGVALVELYQAAGYFQPYDLLHVADEVATNSGLTADQATGLRASYLNYLVAKHELQPEGEPNPDIATDITPDPVAA